MIISEQYFIDDPARRGRTGKDEWGTVTIA